MGRCLSDRCPCPTDDQPSTGIEFYRWSLGPDIHWKWSDVRNCTRNPATRWDLAGHTGCRTRDHDLRRSASGRWHRAKTLRLDRYQQIFHLDTFHDQALHHRRRLRRVRAWWDAICRAARSHNPNANGFWQRGCGCRNLRREGNAPWRNHPW
jgi:hypothetical protein